MTGLIIAAAAGLAALLVWALGKAVRTAAKDRKRAADEHAVRRTQHRLLLGVGAALVVVVAAVALAAFGGLDAIRSVPSRAEAESVTEGPCQGRKSGRLTVTRTSATTASWAYVHGQPVAADAQVLLSLRVGDRHVGGVRALSGQLDLPAPPARVHLEGKLGPDRVYATCIA
ncbi:hypothetical protein [Longispora albida]|uniref:hypothetical protein n=1 Tax=Longispora albida TaxID=203523 RepID=UPI000366C205|nr:hypothetical protein [Longispora albida]